MNKKTKQLNQNLSHDIEDDEVAANYLSESLPLIGQVVMCFNCLEKSLDSFICESISDRTDETGLIVIQKLMYAAKVDLFKRISEQFNICFFTPTDFKDVINELVEVGKLRNMVVHADWSSTNEIGYTFVRLKISSQGIFQEYEQFTVESLNNLIERIIKANFRLAGYWEWQSDRRQDHLIN